MRLILTKEIWVRGRDSCVESRKRRSGYRETCTLRNGRHGGKLGIFYGPCCMIPKNFC